MNLRKTGRTFWVIAAVAIMAMVLQGCGGDDNGGTNGGISPEDQARLNELVALKAVDLPGDMMLNPDTLAALAARADIPQATYDAMAAALGDMPFNVATLEALAARADITPAEEQQLRDALKDAQDELAQLKKENADAIAEAAKADRIARANGILAAITAETIAANAMPTGTGNGVTAVVATRDAAGMITIDVNGATTDDVYSGGATTAGSGDWNSVTMTKDDADGSTDTLVIYTDIEAPADELFTSQYAATKLVDLFDTGGLTADELKLVAADAFPPPSTTYTYGASDRSKSFRGSIDGVEGVFTCTTTGNCEVSADAAGVLSSPTANDWSFRPDAPNTATVKVPDAAYVHFGWWLDKPEDNTAAHDVDVFAGSTAGHDVAVTLLMEGTATYAGPAAGQYATKTFTGGAQTDAAVGDFTASASLTAKFADVATLGTIEGSVTGFNLDDGSSPSWSVTLEEIILTATATFTGTTKANFGGGVTSTSVGAWQGSFYNQTDPTNTDSLPGTVAGTFDAETPNASVIGAFGATKE